MKARPGTVCKALGWLVLLFSLSIAPFVLPDRRPSAPRSQAINCANNLKQIGLAFKTWSLEHEDRLPFNLSTNLGGTKEFSALSNDGFDANGFLHVRVMSNELITPLLLVCPNDRSKTASTRFADLKPQNLSYAVRSGENLTDTNPQAVLLRCPIDGNVLLWDGNVIETHPGTDHKWLDLDPLKDRIQTDPGFSLWLSVIGSGLLSGWLLIRIGGRLSSTSGPSQKAHRSGAVI